MKKAEIKQLQDKIVQLEELNQKYVNMLYDKFEEVSKREHNLMKELDCYKETFDAIKKAIEYGPGFKFEIIGLREFVPRVGGPLEGHDINTAI